jgi:metal-responsive CopG/Arc/MetJ family transcriptional regulator
MTKRYDRRRHPEMPKKKVAVALSDWLLDEVDEHARGSGLSRSAVIQEAAAQYLHEHRTAAETDAYRREALEAMEDMRRIREETKRTEQGDEPSSLEVLRALRATGRNLD